MVDNVKIVNKKLINDEYTIDVMNTINNSKK